MIGCNFCIIQVLHILTTKIKCLKGRGEKLISTSKHYGVMVYAIADTNTNIKDVNLVHDPHKLKIPSTAAKVTQQCISEKRMLSTFDSPEGHQSSSDLTGGRFINMISTARSSRLLQHATATGFFLLLVLVPLIAFSIRCLIGAFNNKVGVNESKKHHLGPKSKRWRSALSDLREPDIFVGDSKSSYSNASEDGGEIPPEEVSHASYTEVERDYQKFLSDCGMSKWGYWRGGSPE